MNQVKNNISPFKPDNFPSIPYVKGVDIKVSFSDTVYPPGRNDVVLFVFENEAIFAGVYTKSSMPSAPVDHCRSLHAKVDTVKILCVNAGNSNAFTGKKGKETIEDTTRLLAEQYQTSQDKVMISSTGVIGEVLDGKKIAKAAIKGHNNASYHEAAQAIMTTDTFAKGGYRKVTLLSGEIIILSGIAKGSGMIAPNMGTMLAFIMTDALIDKSTLQNMLSDIVEGTFNLITVDGDCSTSDTLQVFATGEACNNPLKGQDLILFKEALYALCSDLALQIVKDGEGITKLIKITTSNAENTLSAKKISLSVANSPLVKTAIAGEDANWGRIIAAIGKSGEKANRDKTSLAIGGVAIAREGEKVLFNEEDIKNLDEYMKEDIIEIDISVGVGDAQNIVYTSDLTHRYIDINTDYRS